MDKIMIEDSFKRIFGNKSRILVVMPHPDDTELYCGATVARLTKEGKKVRVVKMTYGDKGSKQLKIKNEKLKIIREREDRDAMKILGIAEEDNIYLGLGDGAIEHNLETIGKVVYQIRQFKPELIITTNPEDTIIRYDKGMNWINHRDHRHTARVAIDAAYPYARDLLFFTQQLKEKGIDSHTCKEFLLVDYYGHPDLVYIDVTDYSKTGVKALACHSSQYSMAASQESADFFTRLPNYGSRRYERFRYVVAD